MNNPLIIPETVYFVAHISVADNRLFDKEWFLIERIIHNEEFGDEVRENVLNIILDRPEKITLEQTIEVLLSMPIDIRMFAIRLGLIIAFEDRSFGDKEYAYFQKLRASLKLDNARFEAMCNEAKSALFETNTAGESNQIIINSNSLFDRYENCLLSANMYSSAVKEMSVIARQDIEYASRRVGEIAKLYRAYPQVLKKQTDTAINNQSRINNAEEKAKLHSFFSELLNSINLSLERSNESLNILRERQVSASDSFTISFMGRTKAGKSTLHSVLLGGLNNEFIGRGSERTTRYNYIYEFQGVRIIDTPGIGAPGGKTDSEIAQEVADESDLICYIVTTDSIQETEFNFLKKLKDRNKPVLILLNKKENIARSSKKMQAFLDDPLKWYISDGEDSIQGHIDRINTYVAMNHDFHNYSIVPIHLLAAKLALKEKDVDKREKLMEGSRINVFIKTLIDTVNSSGTIQRSQTIYNSAIYHLEEDRKSAEEQNQIVLALRNEINRNSDDTLQRIKLFGDRKRNDFINSFNSTFDAFMKADIRRFADQHCDTTQKEFNSAWKEFLSSSKLEQKLTVAFNENWEQYQTRVQDILMDAEEDLDFNLEFGTLKNIEVHKIVDTKFALEGFSAAFSVAGFLVAGVWAVGGLIFGGAAILLLLISLFVKSKDKKIDTAKDKLYSSLVENINGIREKNLAEFLKKYDSSRNSISDQIGNYYNAIDKSLSRIHLTLDDVLFHITEVEQDLNTAYGARIANFMMKSSLYVISEAKSLQSLKVEREFKRQIRIEDSRLYIQPMYYEVDYVEKILQEKLFIIF